MTDESVNRVHWSFWAIGGATLIWNVLGGVNFFIQMDADTVASFPETHRAIINGRPSWATGGFAIGVFGGAVGCVLLLLRKSAAYYMFIASLLGMIVTMFHTSNIAISKIDFSLVELFVMILLPVVVSVFLIWYSKQVESKGWVI